MLTIAFQDQDQTVHQMASAAPVINPGPSDLRISSNDNKKDLYDGNTYPHFDLRPVKLSGPLINAVVSIELFII